MAEENVKSLIKITEVKEVECNKVIKLKTISSSMKKRSFADILGFKCIAGRKDLFYFFIEEAVYNYLRRGVGSVLDVTPITRSDMDELCKIRVILDDKQLTLCFDIQSTPCLDVKSLGVEEYYAHFYIS